MASADSALLVIAKALWNPKPTTDAKSQQYLANALGYPRSWQVVRTIEEKDGKKIIVDRIYAGSPDDGVDMYFNHHAAQAAAADWIEGESNGYEKKGGQLLPRKPKFQKGDRVQVDFEGDWYNATIQKRTERKDGYRYTVFYPEDNTTQTQVKESSIKFMDNPVQVAEQMGLDGGWEAKLSGKKWKFTSPDGKNFTSKVAAMKHYKKLAKGDFALTALRYYHVLVPLRTSSRQTTMSGGLQVSSSPPGPHGGVGTPHAYQCPARR